MSKKLNVRLSIFDTFKTRNDLTGEANRQRSIISILSSKDNPTKKTRTGISQLIAEGHGVVWKNIYSGVFRDLDEVLIPMGVVEEHGRLPLKRGPKALQEKGIPYYHLTQKGILVALSVSEIADKERLLNEFFANAGPEEKEFEKMILNLLKSSPNFTYSIFQKYVKAFYNDKDTDLLPFDLAKLREIPDKSLIIQKEILEAFMTLPKQDKEEAIRFLNKITPKQELTERKETGTGQ